MRKSSLNVTLHSGPAGFGCRIRPFAAVIAMSITLPAMAQTDICGVLDTAEEYHWTAAGNPYIVRCNASAPHHEPFEDYGCDHLPNTGDPGEGNGIWDSCEEYTDLNGNLSYDTLLTLTIDPGVEVIYGGGSSLSVSGALYANDASFDRVTLSLGYALENTSATIDMCTFTGGARISASTNATVAITRSTFDGGSISSGSNAVTTINDCAFNNGTIYNSSSSSLDISACLLIDCNINDSSAGSLHCDGNQIVNGGVNVTGNAVSVITNNDFTGSAGHIQILSDQATTVSGNTLDETCTTPLHLAIHTPTGGISGNTYQATDPVIWLYGGTLPHSLTLAPVDGLSSFDYKGTSITVPWGMTLTIPQSIRFTSSAAAAIFVDGEFYAMGAEFMSRVTVQYRQTSRGSLIGCTFSSSGNTNYTSTIAFGADVEVRDCSFSGRSGLSSSGDTLITGCDFNAVFASLSLSGGGSQTVSDCTFNGTGITVSGNAMPRIAYCIFTNGPLTANNSSLPVIRYCTFAEAARLNARGDPGRVIDARYNFWGTIDPAEIELKISHCIDSGSYPCVDFIPFMEGPVPEENQFYGEQEWRSGSSADPVNTATGNFVHSETDLSIKTRGLPLVMARHYNSLDTREGPLGPGWTHSYNLRLTEESPGGRVWVRWGDGRTDYWMNDGQGGYRPETPGIYAKLIKNPDDTWQVEEKNLDAYAFDSDGRVTDLTDKNGNVITFAYDNGSFPERVTSVIGPAGRALTLAYDTSGVLQSVTDFAVPPREVRYSYTDGRLTQVTDVLGNLITYGYTPEGYLETITDQRGVTIVTNFYDEHGRVIEQSNGNGHTTLFSYDTPLPGQTTITDSLGQLSVHTHEELYKLLQSIENPLGDLLSYEYDERNNRTVIADRNGNDTRFEYDERGSVVRTINADGGETRVVYDQKDLPILKEDASYRVTTWSYDGFGNATLMIDPDDGERSWTYNEFGQVLTQTDENGITKSFTYDSNGLLIAETGALGNTTHYGYDELWRRVWVTDARGSGPEDPAFTTHFTIDAADQLIRIEGPPVGGAPHRIVQSFAYDEVGNRTHVTDGNGNTTVSFIDNNSNLIRVEEPLGGDPQGRVTQYEYDELDRKTALVDANGNRTSYTYDDAGRVILQEDAEGNQTTYAYDAHGNVLSRTDPSGVTVIYTYDRMNSKRTEEDGLGNRSRWIHDLIGNPIRFIDARNKMTDYVYDELDRLVGVFDAADEFTSYEYDPVGNLLTVMNANWNLIKINLYDSNNRLIYAEDGIGYSYRYRYDAVGNQTTVVDAKQLTTTLTYDAENRLIQIDYPDATQVGYTYDDNGNRLSMADPNGSSSFIYDELNRLRSSTDSFGQQAQYDYDSVGNRTSLTYPDDKQVAYGYDQANRLISITDWDARVTQYTHDGLRLETVTYPNGVVENRGYDDAGRLNALDTEDSGANSLLGYAWIRDGVGNPTSVTETGTLQPTLEQLVVDYQYDADNRLTGSSQGNYQHDANGNLTQRTIQAATTDFVYDNEDRLVSQITAGSTVQHLYDGQGNRISRSENGAETRYVLDRGRSMSHVLCETDDTGTITAYYIHGPQIVARIGADGTKRYYHTNDIGTVVALTDENEQLTDRYGYTPFGLPLAREGSTPNPFTYVGGLGVMADADGLFFMRARFYDPDTGRFLGKDPVEGALTQPQGLNRHVYAANEPLVWVDPEGRQYTLNDFDQVYRDTIARFERVTEFTRWQIPDKSWITGFLHSLFGKRVEQAAGAAREFFPEPSASVSDPEVPIASVTGQSVRRTVRSAKQDVQRTRPSRMVISLQQLRYGSNVPYLWRTDPLWFYQRTKQGR